jgi:hypothetical protein
MTKLRVLMLCFSEFRDTSNIFWMKYNCVLVDKKPTICKRARKSVHVKGNELPNEWSSVVNWAAVSFLCKPVQNFARRWGEMLNTCCHQALSGACFSCLLAHVFRPCMVLHWTTEHGSTCSSVQQKKMSMFFVIMLEFFFVLLPHSRLEFWTSQR